MVNNNIPFTLEQDFEEALTQHLIRYGWEEKILKNPTEEVLIQNWADIIYSNNRDVNRLGNYPLTQTEMNQIIEKVNEKRTPYGVNQLINQRLIDIKRDNKDDVQNFDKIVYLKIFDPKEISAGQSRYQIVRQPIFKTTLQGAGDRRGDVLLLINGMPVIEIELKRADADVQKACGQIHRYMCEGVYTRGIFSMIQIFVAMTPVKTLYFANPGEGKTFPTHFFHWADFNNNAINDWQEVVRTLLAIPMAHQMIGNYTIADDKDQSLKVLRSYQYYAVSKICDKVHLTHWNEKHDCRGGYIWHTTGSGKTMTSFKSAQLIANSGDADKVVFLLDRVELSIQSLDEYKGFADDRDSIQDTADTQVLITKLKNEDSDYKMIVTSIQKMSKITPQSVPETVMNTLRKKRIVFILDECHRSVFGDMLTTIKNNFPNALFFGFTGTPIFTENAKKGEVTTADLFGDCLHKYTIANAIPDENVLGFDPYMVCTFKEEELREHVAFSQIDKYVRKADLDFVPTNRKEYLQLVEEDEEAAKIYDRFTHELEMADTYKKEGETLHGVEYYYEEKYYESEKHHLAVAEDIVKSRTQLSKNGKFHAILATKNIPEAITYYEIFKEKYPEMNVATIFDDSIDNSADSSGKGYNREVSILEMLGDYNTKYNMNFELKDYAKYKKDVAKRLAHKNPYFDIEKDHDKQLDLLIVVTQMLTGYDSQWVNTLYVDKLMKYADIIQAFSRTNRLFNGGKDKKPFGTIKYYTYPFTMKQNIDDAFNLYVDQDVNFSCACVDKLKTNLENINQKFEEIKEIFENNDIKNFEKLPEAQEDRNMCAKLIAEMTHLLEAAKLQGFTWDKNEYELSQDPNSDTESNLVTVAVEINEETFNTLLQRYQEIYKGNKDRKDSDPKGEEEEDGYIAIDTFVSEIGTGKINADYINSNFKKYLKMLHDEGPESELTNKAYEVLCKSFASLSQQDQRTALIILHDIQSGDLDLNAMQNIGKSIYDLIYEYQDRELQQQVQTLSEATGIDQEQLIKIIRSRPTEENLNEYNQFEKLQNTINLEKAGQFLKKVFGKDVKPNFVVAKTSKMILKPFILDADQRKEIIKQWTAPQPNDAQTVRQYDLSAMADNYTMAAEEDKNKEYGKK